jgi:hypothetical protein
MGNFSRDPKTRIADSITKHYVGIPLQQAVPLLDADWNELENLRRYQHETLGRSFIGGGVPEGSDGFRIVAVNNDNDFSIRRGVLLLNGKLIVNDADVRYTTQPNAALVPALSTPGSDETSVIYLDAWEREVDGQEDTDLIDDRIGVETCVRLKSEWVVRVAVVASPQNLPVPPTGHEFYPLTLVKRLANNTKITFAMIADLRRLHLTLASATKAPLELYGAAGNLTYTLTNFAQMLELTEKAYFDVLGSDLIMRFNFVAATPLEAVVLSALFNEVMQTALAGALQARVRNLDNLDGLSVLQALYNVQDHLVTNVTPMAAGNPARASTSSLMTRLRQLLDGAQGVPGLKPAAFTALDLPAAVHAQEEINRELGNRMQLLPHGRIDIKLTSGPPAAPPIAANNTYHYNFLVTFVRTTPGPAQQETFDLLPSLNPPGWTVALVNNAQATITLSTEQSITVPVDVTIPQNPPVNSATLDMRVRSRANPTEMDTTNTEAALAIGQAPPQPPVIHLALFAPAMNVATDTLLIGRGGPFNLPGKGRQLIFRFTYDEVVGSPVTFNVKFDFNPAAPFLAVPDSTITLGGSEAATKDSNYVVQATDASINGTTSVMTVTISKASDANVKASLPINVQVQKS